MCVSAYEQQSTRPRSTFRLSALARSVCVYAYVCICMYVFCTLRAALRVTIRRKVPHVIQEQIAGAVEVSLNFARVVGHVDDDRALES